MSTQWRVSAMKIQTTWLKSPAIPWVVGDFGSSILSTSNWLQHSDISRFGIEGQNHECFRAWGAQVGVLRELGQSA